MIGCRFTTNALLQKNLKPKILVKILQKKFFKKNSCSLLFVTIFFASNFLTTNSYAAVDYGIGRIRECNLKGQPADYGEGEDRGKDGSVGLDFDPGSGGKDVEFVLSNPVCVAVIATSYAVTKAGIAVMNNICGTGSKIPRVTPSPLMDAKDFVRAGIKARTNQACAGAVAGAAGTFLAAIGELGVIYGVATLAYNSTEICGASWMSPNPAKYNLSSGGYKLEVKRLIDGYILSDPTKLNLGNKIYREWYYGGVEVEDNPNDDEPCPDVTQDKLKDGRYPPQKFYLKGTETGNYNCKQYEIKPGVTLPSGVTQDQMNAAYACCKKRSQEYICINYSGTKKFCRGGTDCTIGGITYSAKSLDNGRLLCAESYSLCPYNFAIGGGSEYCDYYRDGKWVESEQRWKMITPEAVKDEKCAQNSEIREPNCTYNDKAGKCRNYCQYMRHCTKTSDAGFHYQSSLGSPYFSDACLNFEGDSLNKTAFKGGFIIGSQRHFSAPIAQCVKETLENVFYNRAGHSKCLNYNEAPDANGACVSGQYVTDGNFTYKEGNQVKDKSFFTIVQDTLQLTVKMTLTLSIMLYGMNILLGRNSIANKKDILVYLFKIGLVLYFATGDAWQSIFFDGVYGASAQFSQMVFKIETSQSELKRDGCQFGEITLQDGSIVEFGRYPAGKEYLAIWDTLDCKIMRYLGFGPEVSTANIVSLIFAGFFTGAVGIYFALSVMFFGIFFIAATIRALHIFLSSALSIIIFVFVSPIIIPLLLFTRTKGIFDSWLKELISFCLQPMILFAYIAIFVTVLDRSLIGSAIYKGEAPSKVLSCAEVCKNSDGTTVPYVMKDGKLQPPDCNESGQKLFDPINDSVACIMNVDKFGKFPGFELIGLSIPILVDLLKGDSAAKILLMFKGALIMYLLYKFMDEIPGITTSLIGGTQLPGAAPNAVDMFKKVAKFAAEAQKRATRATGKMLKKGGKGAKDLASKAGSKGKSTAENKDSGGDHAGASGGGGSDSAGGNEQKADSAGSGGGGQGDDSANR
jgi:type IV secretory pathway VirB6-like protein